MKVKGFELRLLIEILINYKSNMKYKHVLKSINCRKIYIVRDSF